MSPQEDLRAGELVTGAKVEVTDQLPQPRLKTGLPSETLVCAAVGRSVARCVSVCE